MTSDNFHQVQLPSIPNFDGPGLPVGRLFQVQRSKIRVDCQQARVVRGDLEVPELCGGEAGADGPMSTTLRKHFFSQFSLADVFIHLT